MPGRTAPTPPDSEEIPVENCTSNSRDDFVDYPAPPPELLTSHEESRDTELKEDEVKTSETKHKKNDKKKKKQINNSKELDLEITHYEIDAIEPKFKKSKKKKKKPKSVKDFSYSTDDYLSVSSYCVTFV